MAETMIGVFVKARATTRLNLLKQIEMWVVDHLAKGKKAGEGLIMLGRPLCDRATQDISRSAEFLASYKVLETNAQNVFMVYTDHVNQWEVNLGIKSCTCKRYDELQIPCVHALKVITSRHLQVHEYCSTKFLSTSIVAAYSEPFTPAILLGLVPETNRRPPAYRNLAGRPRKRRISSRGERNPNNKFRGRCSRCKQHGHYSGTCRNPAVEKELVLPGPNWLARAAHREGM